MAMMANPGIKDSQSRPSFFRSLTIKETYIGAAKRKANTKLGREAIMPTKQKQAKAK